MEILKLLSMKRVFNYVLLVCVMFVLAACGTTKKTQTKEKDEYTLKFSDISLFKTSEKLTGYATDRYPIQKQDEHPIKIKKDSP